jgi:hypothetical protein
VRELGVTLVPTSSPDHFTEGTPLVPKLPDPGEIDRGSPAGQR